MCRMVGPNTGPGSMSWLISRQLGSWPVTAVSTLDPQALAQAAAEALARRTGADRHHVALVLGSGWLPAIEELARQARAEHGDDDNADIEFASTELPGFSPPAVAGHAGTIRSLHVHGKRVLAF